MRKSFDVVLRLVVLSAVAVSALVLLAPVSQQNSPYGSALSEIVAPSAFAATCSNLRCVHQRPSGYACSGNTGTNCLLSGSGQNCNTHKC